MASFPALAYQGGDMILRVGIANVNSDNDDDSSLGIAFT